MIEPIILGGEIERTTLSLNWLALGDEDDDRLEGRGQEERVCVR